MIFDVELNVWSKAGWSCIMSIVLGRWCVKASTRLLLRASHIIMANIIVAVSEITEPMEEITFHVVKASG